LAREEGKKPLHACNLKCENERKERALFELWRSGSRIPVTQI